MLLIAAAGIQLLENVAPVKSTLPLVIKLLVVTVVTDKVAGIETPPEIAEGAIDPVGKVVVPKTVRFVTLMFGVPEILDAL